ncbi:eukaryotic translation initiation factor SUI1 family protein [Abortiporus biennis]|nr:eukaryotic translation initiation factor SUI1 family protein [Abortiporus biennis]
MFKKPLADLKTSAPIRSSDRRKLKQKVVDTYSLTAEVGELLVPDGLQSQKFSTHVNEHGIAYLSREGDPLWFTIGKASDELIPTVYTLWKHPNLLPFLSTPSAVIPKLINGADLMIPGVVQHISPLSPNQLVSVTQYYPGMKVGAQIAVGKMAVSSEVLKESSGRWESGGEDLRGKAVFVLHTWKDWLWDMGPSKKMDLPEPRDLSANQAVNEDQVVEDDVEIASQDGTKKTNDETPPSATVEGKAEEAEQQEEETNKVNPEVTLTPDEVSTVLRSALLQALSTSLASLPTSAYPIPASLFWATHVLPARPIYTDQGPIDPTFVDAKHSSYKSVKAFLKSSAKEGLIKLKEVKGDVVVTAVYPKHPAVASHRSHRTLHSVEEKREKAEERERKEKEQEEKKKSEIHAVELWKPHEKTIPFFVSAEKDTQELYTGAQIKQIFTTYVETKQLINARDQQYVNLADDNGLFEAVYIKGQETPEFMKREEALKRIRDNMQPWHEVKVEGSDAVRKKGAITPITIVVKVRQGRKAATLITGFETFQLDAEVLAEELRKICASSTTVNQLTGKPVAMQVMVQGKQIKKVVEFLISKGVSEKWIKAK